MQLGQEYKIVIPALPGAAAKAVAAKAVAAKAKAVKKVAPTTGLTGYMPYILAGAGVLVFILYMRRD